MGPKQKAASRPSVPEKKALPAFVWGEAHGPVTRHANPSAGRFPTRFPEEPKRKGAGTPPLRHSRRRARPKKPGAKSSFLSQTTSCPAGASAYPSSWSALHLLMAAQAGTAVSSVGLFPPQVNTQRRDIRYIRLREKGVRASLARPHGINYVLQHRLPWGARSRSRGPFRTTSSACRPSAYPSS